MIIDRAQVLDLDLERGTTFSVGAVVCQSNGNGPLDLSGGRANLTIQGASLVDGARVDLVLRADVLPSQGLVRFVASDSQTLALARGRRAYSADLRLSDGTVYRILRGMVSID